MAPLALPLTAAEWNLAAARGPLEPVPGALQTWRGTSGARRVWRATYRGSPEIALTIYEMPQTPGATAFDALQKWQTQAGRMAFYKGRYFGVAESPGAEMATLNHFMMAVEAALPAGDEFHR